MQKVFIQAQLEQFLKNNIGSSGRGFTTLELKKAINTFLTTRQLSRILSDLVSLNVLIFTGHTKGKRFILGDYKEIALYNYNIDDDLASLPYAYPWYQQEMCYNHKHSLIFEEFEKLRKTKRISLKRFCQSLPQFQKKKLCTKN